MKILLAGCDQSNIRNPAHISYKEENMKEQGKMWKKVENIWFLVFADFCSITKSKGKWVPGDEATFDPEMLNGSQVGAASGKKRKKQQ